MAYQKKVWKDLPSEETPLSASGLNNWEDRISKILSATILPNGDMNDPQFWLGIDDGTYYTNGDTNRWTNSRGGWRVYRKTGGLVGTDGGTLGRVEVLFGSNYEIATIGGSPVVLSWNTYEAETNKGYNLTAGTGQTLQQISGLPIGWSGMIRINEISTTKDWWGTKLGASTNGLISVWVLSENARGYETRIVGFNQNGVFMNHLLSQADFIVEQGITNGIYWEKWNSGKLYQYGSMTNNYGTTDSYGALFRSNTTLDKTFPQKFATKPMVRVTPIGANAYDAYVTNTTETLFGHRLVHVFNQNVGATEVFFEAIGTWK